MARVQEEKAPVMDKKAIMKEFARTGQKTYYDYQAKFFLNAFWKEYGEKEAEKVWEFAHQFMELDKKGARGSCLDEFEAAQFLEKNGQAMTVIERRNALKEIDKDTDKKMSLIEYCVWRYKVDIETLMTRPQGVSKELEAIEEKVNAIQADMKKIKKYKKKLDGKQKPEGGPKLIIYEQDKKNLESAEKNLTQNLDFAMRKLKAAGNNKDLVAPGKTWWLQREIEEAKKWAAPKKKVIQ